MPLQTFIAESAADAVAQIRAQLGPDAVVLNVRRLPASGISRLWQKSRIEVQAHLPDAPTPASPDPLAELREQLAAIRRQVEQSTPAAAQRDAGPVAQVSSPAVSQFSQPARHRTSQPARLSQEGAGLETGDTAADLEVCATRGWRVGTFLESSGFLPLHAQRVVEELRAEHGDVPPTSLAKELDLARGVLLRLWSARPRPAGPGDVHVFIGPPGSGKTTALCKWLAQTVLGEGRTAEVWRLDGRTANTAESLSVYGEILGVPVERFAPAARGRGAELLFIDLPGVDWTHAAEVEDLGRQLRELPEARTHLVLNAAYETPLLLAQARAFASLPIAGLVLTHLDEEARWGKLWNLVLGTNYLVGFLSAGQNVPGVFTPATAELLLARQLPSK